MPESIDAIRLQSQMHHHKRHETREMQFQLERIAAIVEKEEPIPAVRKPVIARTLREMARFLEAEYEEHTRTCETLDARLKTVNPE